MAAVPIGQVLEEAGSYPERFGRPLVTLAYAQSLDGCIAARRGNKLALSGPDSQALTHRLRAAHDCVLVGIGTVLADDPCLNVRLAEGRDPRPVILDSHLRLPLDSHLLDNTGVAPWIFTTPKASLQRRQRLEAAGAQVVALPATDNGWVDPGSALKALAARGIRSVMVEGGARIITSFLRKRLVDRLVVTVAPLVLGGVRAVEQPLFGPDHGTPDTSLLPALQQLGYEQMGADIVVWADLQWPD